MNELAIEELKIFAYHGCMEVEQAIGSYYEINLNVRADLSKVSQTDNIMDTVNYVVLNSIIHEQMAIVSKTIENVCERILNTIHEQFPEIQWVRLKISKINPPVHGDMKKFSVIFERNYSL